MKKKRNLVGNAMLAMVISLGAGASSGIVGAAHGNLGWRLRVQISQTIFHLLIGDAQDADMKDHYPLSIAN